MLHYLNMHTVFFRALKSKPSYLVSSKINFFKEILNISIVYENPCKNLEDANVTDEEDDIEDSSIFMPPPPVGKLIEFGENSSGLKHTWNSSKGDSADSEKQALMAVERNIASLEKCIKEKSFGKWQKNTSWDVSVTNSSTFVKPSGRCNLYRSASLDIERADGLESYLSDSNRSRSRLKGPNLHSAPKKR